MEPDRLHRERDPDAGQQRGGQHHRSAMPASP
jgi:hypothetical protein